MSGGILPPSFSDGVFLRGGHVVGMANVFRGIKTHMALPRRGRRAGQDFLDITATG